MKKQEKTLVAAEETQAEKGLKKVQNTDAEFSDSISTALKQKNEKGFFAGVLAIVFVVVILLVAALADLLTLCFSVHPYFGYAACVAFGVLVALFVVRPVFKVVGARFFITDVTNLDEKKVRRKNARAVKQVAKALVEYNKDPKNAKFKYVKDENLALLSSALKTGEALEIQAVLKDVYAGDVGKCANGLIFKSAGKVFLTTSVSQNDKIDALSVLLVNLSLVKQIVGIYGYRPSYAKLFRIYTRVLKSALTAYGMENVNWFNVFGKFFTGVAKKIPFIDTVVDSAVQGTVSAFLTLLVGYKTKKYLCSDYKKQEKLSLDGGVETADEEVKIASALAGKIRKQKQTDEPFVDGNAQ